MIDFNVLSFYKAFFILIGYCIGFDFFLDLSICRVIGYFLLSFLMVMGFFLVT